MTPSSRRSAFLDALTALPIGTRVVVRYRIAGGNPAGKTLTDALGFLVQVSDLDCTVRTRQGDVVVELAKIVAAKQVPPAPARRGPRVS